MSTTIILGTLTVPAFLGIVAFIVGCLFVLAFLFGAMSLGALADADERDAFEDSHEDGRPRQ